MSLHKHIMKRTDLLSVVLSNNTTQFRRFEKTCCMNIQGPRRASRTYSSKTAYRRNIAEQLTCVSVVE
jgi:hypothetical protein